MEQREAESKRNDLVIEVLQLRRVRPLELLPLPQTVVAVGPLGQAG